ncbi:hypothetical protein M440DRAFT_1172374 [Trichoderma longibrachiatum ATCC 18648]|uniref:Uncharacterized protein n=1 Tax=Trichoderma longibrachiatum ATCC 18648 TaxID=983965 RepID=A0A2T4CDC4_TRILO|nr:hypothetical protein M440DRAFT_1172374 [Trichoderma longibrachiatum ATCC 18648]
MTHELIPKAQRPLISTSRRRQGKEGEKTRLKSRALQHVSQPAHLYSSVLGLHIWPPPQQQQQERGVAPSVHLCPSHPISRRQLNNTYIHVHTRMPACFAHTRTSCTCMYVRTYMRLQTTLPACLYDTTRNMRRSGIKITIQSPS